MANSTENFILVEVEDQPLTRITNIVRSYLSQRRAQQDLDLLSELNPGKVYELHTVEHIDD
jgi:hypothetical protein